VIRDWLFRKLDELAAADNQVTARLITGAEPGSRVHAAAVELCAAHGGSPMCPQWPGHLQLAERALAAAGAGAAGVVVRAEVIEALAAQWEECGEAHRHDEAGPAEGAAGDTLVECARGLRDLVKHRAGD
jgi:hypothetical protein